MPLEPGDGRIDAERQEESRTDVRDDRRQLGDGGADSDCDQYAEPAEKTKPEGVLYLHGAPWDQFSAVTFSACDSTPRRLSK